MKFRRHNLTDLVACSFILCVVALFAAMIINGTRTSASHNEANPARPELVLQTGHSQGVNCAVFGPDGSWLASGGADNLVKLWQVATGRELRALKGHSGYVKALAASPDGRWLAAGGNDRVIIIWEVATGRAVVPLTGHVASIEVLTFSPDSGWLASASADKSLRIWDAASGKEIKTIGSKEDQVTALAFSGNGKWLASGSADALKLWDTNTWQVVRTFPKRAGGVTALAFSADGNSLASASADGTVRLWPTNSDRERFTMKQNPSSAVALAFSLNGLLTVAHADGALEVWDATNGNFQRAIPGDKNSDHLKFAAFAPNAGVLAFGEGSRSISLRMLNGGSETRRLESHSTQFNAVDFSNDGRWFAAAANDASIRLWQTATGRELPRLIGHSGYVNTIAFSPDSNLLASGSRSGEVKVWNLDTQQLEYSLPSGAQGIDNVAFSPEGKFLAVAGMDPTVKIWELETKRARTLSGHTDEVTSVVFSVDGQSLYSAGRDKTVRVWDLKTGSVIRTLDTKGAEVNSLAASSDGKFLAAALTDKTVNVWDLSTTALSATLSGSDNEVLKVNFSPDSQFLASAGSDHKVKVWDLKNGHNLRTLEAASGDVNGVVFSNDGRWIFSASEDGSLMVWEAASGSLMATLVSVPSTDDWLVVTPDGLFDGSPSAWNLLLWRFGGDTFGVLPVEAYFNEFFNPGVLAEILAGKKPKPAQDITQRDRRQPRVTISSDTSSDTKVETRRINIKLEINDAEPDKTHASGSGARDLRLFRNGLLIRQWPGDVLKGAARSTVEATVPLVAGSNQLSAYAFNNDNIKSVDANLSLTGANKLSRVGTAYLLVIGVAQYENKEYNLQYPVADAAEISAQLKNQQELIGRYNPIVTIPLYNADATKANILTALHRLAGAEKGPLPAGAPRALATIPAAQPEDAVIVYFSGHGTAAQDRFYLIPHDLGYKGARDGLDANGLQTIIAHSISDLDLEYALSSLDADQLLLLLDACNSGQALTAEERRRGPMNTRGLAQLAYEKGMYVLAASQSREVAYESESFKHSYLAFALLEEGIKSGLADRNHDGQILLQEWFGYASERVPELRRQKVKRTKELIEEEADEQKVQRPRVFYTREGGAEKLVIARVPPARTAQ